MGAADIVPGVSGGTIAFIFGIYEELIYSIKTVSGEVPKLFLQGKFKEGWNKIPFTFLIFLGSGLFTALLTLSKIFSYLLHEYPAYLWSFFFGLVLASVIVVKKRVVNWTVPKYIAMALSAVAAYFLVGAVPVETPSTLPAFFLSGAIAICAMILPGISGSFLLLIMGKYEQILQAVVDRDIITLAVFMLGAIAGLALFSRVLSWLFKSHHDITVAILTGFMLGSLRKIWPWKEVLTTRINSKGEVVALQDMNILPSFDMSVMLCVVLAIVGTGLILFLERFNVTEEHTADVESKEFKKEHKEAIQQGKE